MNETSKYKLSDHAIEEINGWLKKYPEDQKQSAVLAALREVQHENNGYLTTEMMDAVADYLGMPRIAVYEVGSFYSMLETSPVGHHSISICTNISCMLKGSDEMVAHTEKKLASPPVVEGP
jgi:NADH-quinone oxidoreductase subunit E